MLDGNLVLVAAGDLTMGERTTKSGAVAFTNVDQHRRQQRPRGQVDPENPLAGLNRIAAQVRRAGTTQVHGNVVVDDRLFKPDPALTSEDPELDRVVSGTMAQNAGLQLQVMTVPNPAAFARKALIWALARAGVSVSARTTGLNPVGQLPPSSAYSGIVLVAAYVSPLYREYATLILKVSHNSEPSWRSVCWRYTTRSQLRGGSRRRATVHQRVGVDLSQVGLAGYLQAGVRRCLPFAEFVNNAFFRDIQGIVRAGLDLGEIAALLQQQAAG